VFVVNGKHYLVSAGHVLVLLKEHPQEVGVPCGRDQAQATSLGDGLHVLPIDWDRFDFGVFRIDSSGLIASLRSAWRFIVPDDLGLLSDEVERFAFAGYPIGRREFKSELHGALGRLTAVSPRYRKKPFEELNRELHSNTVPLDPAIDFLLEYPDRFVDLEGKEIPALDVHGISGSPLWAVRPDPMGLLANAPEQRLRLVGIETGVIEGEYIRGKRWNLIAAAFKQIDSDASDEMFRCLAR